tara:strand:+ start:82 stop:249 length:168 start_codon:yes stop_codon:yes gene_type:complete
MKVLEVSELLEEEVEALKEQEEEWRVLEEALQPEEVVVESNQEGEGEMNETSLTP